ncbi:unnamed protein product [Gongylonema pulchrum]|uniref:DM domain-containing protein n=1 Tax=Gongylonema pulchrum TaxID=637853 RepID=A0A183E2E3_9BILA|nr:unnamed protein product [Gongylonema pulchrum]
MSGDLEQSSSADDQPTAAKRSLSDTGIFEEEGVVSMTNTECLRAMVDLAAGIQSPPPSTQQGGAGNGEMNQGEAATAAAGDESSSVDTGLLMRLGLSKSDLLPSSPLHQKHKFLGQQQQQQQQLQQFSGGGAIRSHLMTNAPIPIALDTTKSVRLVLPAIFISYRTVSKRLPTGEVVKVRTTRKCVDTPVAPHMLPTTSLPSSVSAPVTVASATATISDTRAIVSFRDLTATPDISDERAAAELKFKRDAALARLVIRTKAFNLVKLPEFKVNYQSFS